MLAREFILQPYGLESVTIISIAINLMVGRELMPTRCFMTFVVRMDLVGIEHKKAYIGLFAFGWAAWNKAKKELEK